MGDILKMIGVRGFGLMIGLVFILAATIAFVVDTKNYIDEPPVKGPEYIFAEDYKDVSFASDGLMGNWDKAQLQRGFQVFNQVCSACHGLQYVNFRSLEDLGYSEDAVKAIAAQKQVPSINPDTGEQSTRPALPSDAWPSPFPNEIAARAANNNAYPPDLSLITKARAGGAPYIYSLLTGYQDPPAELLENYPDAAPTPGLYYNPYFKGLNIAMANPLIEGIVEYEGENAPEATAEQMAKDVTAFLIWTGEPSLISQKRTGIGILIFLAFATIFSFLAYRNVWANAKRKVAAKGPLDPENMAHREHAKDEAAEEGRGVKG